MAEKLHAMVMLGARNSRMKDYFDLHALWRNRLGWRSRAYPRLRHELRVNESPLEAATLVASAPSGDAELKAFPIGGACPRYHLSLQPSTGRQCADSNGRPDPPSVSGTSRISPPSSSRKITLALRAARGSPSGPWAIWRAPRPSAAPAPAPAART
jgi:hypothetical protein